MSLLRDRVLDSIARHPAQAGAGVRNERSMFAFVGACAGTAALCGLLSACGGGGGGDVGDGSDGTSSGDWVTSGKVADSAGAGVSGAVVSLTLGQKTYSATSDANGRYALHTPRNLDYPPAFAGSVSKPGLMPAPVFFAYSSGQLQVDSASANPTLPAQTEADLVFPKGVGVTHLGDAQFGTGGFNSQLQLPSSGLYWNDASPLTPAQASKYKSITLSFYARGVESQAGDKCKDLVSVADADNPPGSYIVKDLPGSDPNGGYTRISVTFALSSIGAGHSVLAQLNSGACASGDLGDDFEFVSVVGKLAP